MVYEYVGNGQFFSDIPARDLEADDIARLSDKQLALVASGGLYKKAAGKKKTRQQGGSQKEKRNALAVKN